MLRDLLRLTGGRGSAEVGALARALGVSPRQVVPMLETLERQGYLARTGAGCDRPCERCPMRTACPPENRVRLWRQTPKGARLLEGPGLDLRQDESGGLR